MIMWYWHSNYQRWWLDRGSDLWYAWGGGLHFMECISELINWLNLHIWEWLGCNSILLLCPYVGKRKVFNRTQLTLTAKIQSRPPLCTRSIAGNLSHDSVMWFLDLLRFNDSLIGALPRWQVVPFILFHILQRHININWASGPCCPSAHTCPKHSDCFPCPRFSSPCQHDAGKPANDKTCRYVENTTFWSLL